MASLLGAKGADSPDSAVSDFFEDEERMGGLLKTLISAQGLNTAWQRVGKRLKGAEDGVKRAEGVIERLPEDYISTQTFREVVQERHAGLLEEHAERLRKLEAMVERLSKAVFEDQQPKVEDVLSRMLATEASQADVSKKTLEAQCATEELQTKVLGDLTALTDSSERFQADSDAAFKELKTNISNQMEGLLVDMRQGEKDMQLYVSSAIEKSHVELTSVGDGAEHTEQQAKMLEFIQKHVGEPLRHALSECIAKHQALAEDVRKQKEDTAREIRGAHKTAVDAGIRMKQVAGELKADLDQRPKRTEVQNIEGVISTNINSVSSSMNSLQSKVTTKLNEFVDHFGKLHETIDDHEHVLRHHAEEIENRSTKYDLLTCQHQLDRCAIKDDFVRESAEVRKILNWQTSKIEGFGLAMAPVKKRVKVRKGARLRVTVDSRYTGSQQDSTDVPDDGDASLKSSHSSLVDEQFLKKRLTNCSVDSDMTLMANPIPEGSERRQSTTTSEGDEEEETSEEEQGSLSDSDAPGSSVLRQQLECVAMGLVGLGHLALRETRLGTSRNQKIVMEKELLDDLMNLRHWVSNRMAPAGWDPKKLTTLALRCSHPREEEVQHPLPQLSLKGLVGTNETFPPSRKRMPSAEPMRTPTSTGLKTGPALAMKGSLSARAHPAAGPGQGLPPLHTVAAA